VGVDGLIVEGEAEVTDELVDEEACDVAVSGVDVPINVVGVKDVNAVGGCRGMRIAGKIAGIGCALG
jgi:hypothetical protein